MTAPAPRTPTPLLNIAKPDADRLITAAAQGDPSAIEFWLTLFQKHAVPSTDREQPTLFYCWFCDRETTAPMPYIMPDYDDPQRLRMVAPTCEACWALPDMVKSVKSFRLLKAQYRARTGKNLEFWYNRRR